MALYSRAKFQRARSQADAGVALSKVGIKKTRVKNDVFQQTQKGLFEKDVNV
jgi:hypothetical protein